MADKSWRLMETRGEKRVAWSFGRAEHSLSRAELAGVLASLEGALAALDATEGEPPDLDELERDTRRFLAQEAARTHHADEWDVPSWLPDGLLAVIALQRRSAARIGELESLESRVRASEERERHLAEVRDRQRNTLAEVTNLYRDRESAVDEGKARLVLAKIAIALATGGWIDQAEVTR